MGGHVYRRLWSHAWHPYCKTAVGYYDAVCILPIRLLALCGAAVPHLHRPMVFHAGLSSDQYRRHGISKGSLVDIGHADQTSRAGPSLRDILLYIGNLYEFLDRLDFPACWGAVQLRPGHYWPFRP